MDQIGNNRAVCTESCTHNIILGATPQTTSVLLLVVARPIFAVALTLTMHESYQNITYIIL